MSRKSYLGLDTFILIPMGGLLITSQFAQVISPERIPLLAFAGLVFPYVLLFFLAGIMVRIVRRFWNLPIDRIVGDYALFGGRCECLL